MAASLAIASVTPDCIKYTWTHDGSGSGTVARTQTQMIADAATAAGISPLAQLLTNATSDTAWNALQTSGKMNIYVTVVALAAGTGVAASLNTFSTVHALHVVGLDANAGSALIEVRFHNTLTR